MGRANPKARWNNTRENGPAQPRALNTLKQGRQSFPSGTRQGPMSPEVFQYLAQGRLTSISDASLKSSNDTAKGDLSVDFALHRQQVQALDMVNTTGRPLLVMAECSEGAGPSSWPTGTTSWASSSPASNMATEGGPVAGNRPILGQGSAGTRRQQNSHVSGFPDLGQIAEKLRPGCPPSSPHKSQGARFRKFAGCTKSPKDLPRKNCPERCVEKNTDCVEKAGACVEKPRFCVEKHALQNETIVSCSNNCCEQLQHSRKQLSHETFM